MSTGVTDNETPVISAVTQAWGMDVAAVAAKQRTDIKVGLTTSEVAERRERHGSNSLVGTAPVASWQIGRAHV